MGVKNSMNTFFSAMQGQNSSGYGGRLVNTPMGPFRWDDNYNMWINVNNGMALSNISFQDEFAIMMNYDTLSGGYGGNLATVGDGSVIILDFSSGSLPSGISLVARNSISYYIGSNGYLTAAAVNTPRFEYDCSTNPATLKGLLLEADGANQYYYSGDLTQIGGTTAWVGLNCNTPTINASIPDPLGGASAYKVVATAGAGYHAWKHYGPSGLSGNYFTISIYAKAGEYDKLSVGDATSGVAGATYDLTAVTATKIAGSITPAIASIQLMGNSWYRCSLTLKGSTNSYDFGWIGYPASASVGATGATYTADGTSGLYLYGAQLEIGNGGGAPLSSYIPTSGTTASRALEYLKTSSTPASGNTANSINFNDLYNQTSGLSAYTIFLDYYRVPGSYSNFPSAFVASLNGSAPGSTLYADFRDYSGTSIDVKTANINVKSQTIGSVTRAKIALSQDGITYATTAINGVTGIAASGPNPTVGLKYGQFANYDVNAGAFNPITVRTLKLWPTTKTLADLSNLTT